MDETRPDQECGGEYAGGGPQQLVDMGSATIKTERGTIHTLTIVGIGRAHV